MKNSAEKNNVPIHDINLMRSAMSNPIISRPDSTEFTPYYGKYIDLVPEGDLIKILNEQFNGTLALFSGITEAQSLARYEPGKWSIKEVIGHMIDAERIMSYRALRIARADETPLAGFEQDDYVRAAHFDARPFAEIVDEFHTVRNATVALFRGFDAAAIARRGTANNASITVRALAYIIAGHERHHVAVLQAKYLPLLKKRQSH
jgi:hypothetical protein